MARSGHDCCNDRQAGTDINWSLVTDLVAKISAVFISLQMEQVDRSHSVGFLLLKSTILRMGEGSFAEINCTVNLFADRFVNKV